MKGGAASAKPAQEYNGSVECIAKEALRVVEAACREKEECTVKTDAKSFMVDPCPRRSQVRRGRVQVSTDHVFEPDSMRERRPQPTLPQESAHRNLLGQFRRHRKGRAGMSAETGRQAVRLSVPKEILKDLDIGGSDSAKDKLDEDEEGYVEEARYQPSTFSPAGDPYASAKPLPARPMDRNALPVAPNKKNDVQSDRTAEDEKHVNCTLGGNGHRAVGFVTEWVAAYKFIQANKEKFILYVTLSVGCGVVAFLVVLSARLYVQRRRDRQRAKAKCSEPLSCSFDDSDGGGGGDQFDVTGGRHAHTIEVVRYANRSGMRRQDSDTHPRAPMSRSMNNYYYS
ncbi:hypothetical protein MRX96_004988 [Rhipicephalus microplus]